MAITVKRAKGKSAARGRRHLRVRKRITGTAARPRLVVTRSSRHIFVQVVDDVLRQTVASASTMESDVRDLSGDKTAKAKKVGELVAQRAKDAGIESVVFDRRRQPLPRSRRSDRRWRPRRWAVAMSAPMSTALQTVEKRNI